MSSVTNNEQKSIGEAACLGERQPLQDKVDDVSKKEKPFALIMLFSVLGLAGQYLFKAGMSDPQAISLVSDLSASIVGLGQNLLGSAVSILVSTLLLIIQPQVFLGLLCYVMSTVCWLAILRKTDLSFAYPMISIGYVGILLMGWLVFGEQVTLIRWLGVFLILMGIVSIYSEELCMKYSRPASWAMILIAVGLVLGAPSMTPAAHFDKPIGLIICCLPLGIIGQVLFKAGVGRPVNGERLQNIADGLGLLKSGKPGRLGQVIVSILRLFLSPLVFCGLVAYAVSTILWLVMLTMVPLSFLYPLLSVGYVIILLMGRLVFHETVSALRWYGVFLICYGIVFIYAEQLICAHILAFVAVLMGLAIFLRVYGSRIFKNNIQ